MNQPCGMSLVYIVRWRCTTSCDLVRPSKITLRYPTMLGISAKFLNITNTRKTSGDDLSWLRRRTITHDSPRSPIFTHLKSSYGVVKAGVTVALENMNLIGQGIPTRGFSLCNISFLVMSMATITYWTEKN